MTLRLLLWWSSVGAALAGVALYVTGVVRRWRKGPDGRPAWASAPDRFREPWTAAAFALVIVAVMLQALSRML